MTPSSVIGTKKCRKRRRSHSVHSIPKSSRSYIITILLAALAVVAQGESRTLRHLRPRNHGDAVDAVDVSASSRIEEQWVILKPKYAVNGDPNDRGIDNENGGDTITTSLFPGSDDQEFEQTQQYGIGKHPSSDSRSSSKSDNLQKSAPWISIQTTDIGESQNIEENKNNDFTEDTVDYSDYDIMQTNNINEKHTTDTIVKNMFDEPEERHVSYYYAIGKGEEEPLFQKAQADESSGFPEEPRPIEEPVMSPTTNYPTQSLAKSIPTTQTSIPVDSPVRTPLGQPTMLPVGSPTRNPIDEPQRPKPEPPGCSSGEEECCIDNDCVDSTGDLCIQRTCISEGSFRITLEWVGDDDLNLIVETPSSATISHNSDSDTESGGRFESSKESAFGFNVESVYFPSTGASAGIYTINVDAVAVEGVGADVWTMRIFEDGVVKLKEAGFGNSAIYFYNLKSENTPDSGLCNFDSDCENDNQVCVQDVCVKEGNPRFTLQFPKGSFYSLTVITPDGRHISAFSPFDAGSGGIFEGPTQQLTRGDDVENVYFPIEGAPYGLYTYYVTNSGGDNSKEWKATVHVNGESVAMQTGTGSSDLFSFQFGEKPQINCASTSDCLSLQAICIRQICIDQGAPQFVLSWDGSSDISLSVATPLQTILSSNTPFDFESGGKFERFDITDSNIHIENIYFAPVAGPNGVYQFYIHSDDDNGDTWAVSIFVDGEEITSYSGKGTSEILFFKYAGNLPPVGSPSQEPTGEPISQQPTEKFTSQQPTAKPTSQQPTVKPTSQQSVAQPTNQQPAVEPPGQQPVAEPPGQQPVVEPPGQQPVVEPPGQQPVVEPPGQKPVVGPPGQKPVVEPPGQKPITEPPGQGQCDESNSECCVDADCSSDESCVYEVCLKKGAPQFVLSSEGNQDIALAIQTPGQTLISFEYTFDPESGGKYEGYFDIENNRRIESIYFAPNEGPVGIYPYYIHSFETDSNDDTWTLSILIDGKEVRTRNGKGSSEVFFFYYSGVRHTISPAADPTIQPTTSRTTDPTMIPTTLLVGDPTADPTMHPEKEVEKDECEPFAVADGETIAIIDGECCFDSDCFPNEACTSRTCVDEGNPRFTLSWKGANDLDLLVVTPLETIISFSDLEDPLSGGRFGEDYDQFEYGLHVENIYFPLNDGPIGEYSIYVRSFLSNGNDNEWTVGVYVDGEEQLSVTGTGSSNVINYTFSPDL